MVLKDRVRVSLTLAVKILSADKVVRFGSALILEVRGKTNEKKEDRGTNHEPSFTTFINRQDPFLRVFTGVPVIKYNTDPIYNPQPYHPYY